MLCFAHNNVTHESQQRPMSKWLQNESKPSVTYPLIHHKCVILCWSVSKLISLSELETENGFVETRATIWKDALMQQTSIAIFWEISSGFPSGK